MGRLQKYVMVQCVMICIQKIFRASYCSSRTEYKSVSTILFLGILISVIFYHFLYQVFYVIVQFRGPLPESVLIQRQKLPFSEQEMDMTEQSWLDWQYMARNCNVFDMQNNGPLPRPDSVNCQQMPRLVNYID